jgi:hypothetical protein
MLPVQNDTPSLPTLDDRRQQIHDLAATLSDRQRTRPSRQRPSRVSARRRVPLTELQLAKQKVARLRKL